jgi:hypothetical protein
MIIPSPYTYYVCLQPNEYIAKSCVYKLRAYLPFIVSALFKLNQLYVESNQPVRLTLKVSVEYFGLSVETPREINMS